MLILEKICRSYQTQVVTHALRRVDLEVEDGEFLALTGPSGSGKTTLLNCIGTIDRPSSGKITIGDQHIEQLNAKQQVLFRRNHVGFIFQSYHLLPVLTVFENVALSLELLCLPNAEIRKRCDAILEQVGLLALSDRFPSKLSGGQQQRVAIARALIKQPQLVLADEPTANLDSNTANEILQLMAELNQRLGLTFIFSTHDPMVVSKARRQVILHDGEIVKDQQIEA